MRDKRSQNRFQEIKARQKRTKKKKNKKSKQQQNKNTPMRKELSSKL